MICYIKKIINRIRTFVFALFVRIQLIVKGIVHPNSLKVNGFIRFAVEKNAIIEIGDSVTINSGWRYNPSGGNARTLLCVKSNASLTIGNGSGISNSTIVSHKSVSIGENVNIGVNCIIYDTDFHSVEYEFRKKYPDMHIKTASVVIDDGAWICGHCIILKGVHIGKRSVVAAGSVVTKSIPDDELWGGNPARFIRKINIE